MAVEKERFGMKWREIGRRIAHLGTWVLILGMTQAQAQSDEIRRKPAPEWVVRVERGAVDDKLLDQASGGSFYLLSDAQVNTQGNRSIFRRYASVAINAAGVDSLATIEINFDPTYQALEVNSIDLIREGRTINKLANAHLRLLQRETEFDRRIYDGSKTAMIFLEDVRVGDIVDYSYTVHGRNPVFGGREFGALGLQFNVPVGRLHSRLLLPANGNARVVPRNTGLEAQVTERNGLEEYVWDGRNVSAMIPDADAPVWHDPYPLVQWSEFKDWAAVSRWALPLYSIPDELETSIESEIKRIASTETSDEGRLLAALRFVQGEIRYLGVEVGPGSHAPSPPDQVLARRFGDCKDKTLLTVTLLDRLGIEAHPALVATGLRRAIAQRLPSPGAFDHVIVQAKLDGQVIWLDPTRPTQNADLDHLVQADFDLALVVDTSTEGLVAMNGSRSSVPMRQVKVTFDASAGLEEPVLFNVVTTTEGERAEELRSTLATTSIEELQKGYINFYAGYYSGLKIEKPLQVEDDERTNRIVTTERYRIPEFSIWSEDEKRHTANIPTPDLDEVLRGPKTTIRNAPLGIPRAANLTVITETLLPEAWTIEPDRMTVDDPAFNFERVITPKGDRLVITDRFQSLVDEVAAADAARYAEHLSDARDQTYYHLYWGQADSPAARGGLDRINWLLVVIGSMSLGFWVWLALKTYRFDPRALGHPKGIPSGLGGWLVVPAIGLIATPIATLYVLYTSLDALAADTWASLTTFGRESYHALWAPILLFDLIAMLGTFVFGILLIFLFFSRRSSVPRIFICFQLATSATMLIDVAMINAIPQADPVDMPQTIRTLLGSVIWIAYFLQSVRVRNTFVVRLQEPVALPAVPREAFTV